MSNEKTSIQIEKKMFCFDHFAAWMFLVDIVSDGLATTKYKEKCDVGELPCYFWWLSMTFMLLPTLGAQSFTSLKADTIHQDIHRSALLWNISLKEILCSGFGNLYQKRRLVFFSLLIWVNVPMS